MRQTLLILTFLVALMVAEVAAVASTGTNGQKLWSNMCASCHNGSTAPDREALKEKYQTIENFQKAVYHKGDRCMNILKNDPDLIRRIGKEIGLED